MNNYDIRSATKEDCSAIHQLIQDLANYEKMPDGPHLSVQELERDGFGEHRCFEAFVAECSATGEISGCAVCADTYATWQGRSLFIEDIYVKPEQRGLGIGKALFRKVVELAVEKNCQLINFAVLDWNKPSIDFYKAMGAEDSTETEGWHLFCMQRQQMNKLLEK